MNERLSTRNLAEHLAYQTGLDRKRAEEFIDALTSYFTQGLERNKVVKIFGLGVFKIMLVRERESVHIQTGERFVIPAHHKLSFIPDKNFKEQINRPFALFEPIEATENDMIDFNYDDELSPSIQLGDRDHTSYFDELPDLAPLANDADYEDDQTPLTEGAAYEDELPPLAEGAAYEDTPTPLAEGADYEDKLPPLAEGATYEDTPTPLAEGAAYEDELPPLAKGAAYEDELPPLVEGAAYEDAQPLTPPSFNDDYFDIDLLNEVMKKNNEETFFEDFGYEKESKPVSPHDNNLFEEQTISGFSNDTSTNKERIAPDFLDVTPANEAKNVSESFLEDLEYDIQAAHKSLSEELPYDLVSVSTTYTHKPDEMETTVPENEEAMDAESSYFAPGKKRRKALVWFYLLVIPVCVIIGSIIGAYIFLGLNTDRTLKVKQNQDIPITDFGTTSLIDDDADFNDLLPELNPNPEGNNDDLVNNGSEDALPEIIISENNTSDSNSIRKREIEPVTDWLIPSPDNTRNSGTRRANEPNRALEERNRALTNTRQTTPTGSTVRTTDNSNTTTATATAAAGTKSFPANIKMSAGTTLTQIALDYYGNKVFWVYIYEHNKSRINDPHRVPIGTELQLPAPSAYGIDSKNAASLQRAAQKQAQYN